MTQMGGERSDKCTNTYHRTADNWSIANTVSRRKVMESSFWVLKVQRQCRRRVYSAGPKSTNFKKPKKIDMEGELMQQINLNLLKIVGIHRHSKGIITLELNLEHRTAWSPTQGPLGGKQGYELMHVHISPVFHMVFPFAWKFLLKD